MPSGLTHYSDLPFLQDDKREICRRTITCTWIYRKIKHAAFLVMLCHFPIACCHHISLHWKWCLASFYSAPEQHLAPRSPTFAMNLYFSFKGALPRSLSLNNSVPVVLHSWNNHVTKKGEVNLKEAKPQAQTNPESHSRVRVGKQLKRKVPFHKHDSSWHW